ncbi:MAG: ORF6N domain-containing protein [Bdellovibrionaceae bacterium]|nr:ORF6N domain-containing protein [Pseudobdellovibrionaceae bacterium]
MSIVLQEQIEKIILVIRDQRVLLDSDLARIYGVSTKQLNQQVKRNLIRFPQDFMFQLTDAENESLKVHFAVANKYGGRRTCPFVFTEHGTVMLASILNSPIAVSASIQVVRAFINLRRLLSSQAELARKLELLERKYDNQFKVVFDAIRELALVPDRSRKRIGIKQDDG